jgi:hypothetical protein
MPLAFIKQLFSGRQDQARGCTLIDKIAALAQSSPDLNSALSSAADEIGRTLDLERAAILLRDESGMRRTGDYCSKEKGFDGLTSSLQAIFQRRLRCSKLPT